MGAGIFEDFSAIEKFIEVTNRVESDENNQEFYQKLINKYNAVYEALLPVF